MNATEHTTPARGLPVDRVRLERIKALLHRYPALTDPEVHEVLLFLRKGKVLEIGVLTSNELVKPQLDRFRADHARDLSIGKRELAVVGILMLIVLAAVSLLWNAGVSH
jgi:hypothetical protein